MFMSDLLARVIMEDSTTKALVEVKLGDMVAGPKGPRPVTTLFKTREPNALHVLNDRLILASSALVKSDLADIWLAVDPTLAREEYPTLSIKQLRIGDFVTTLFGAERVSELVRIQHDEPPEVLTLGLQGPENAFYLNKYLVHNKGGGSSGGTTVQTTEPPKFIQPYLKDIAGKAQDAFSLVPEGGFQGQLLAGVDPKQQEALGTQEDVARGLGTSGFGSQTQALADQNFQRILGGDILAPLSERFQSQSQDTSALIQASLDPVQDRLVNQIIPGIQSQAIQGGAFGGSRQDAVTGQALQDFSREAGNISAGINFSEQARTEDQRFQDLLSIREFAPELERINQAALLSTPSVADAAVQQQLLSGALLGEVGAADRGFAQQGLDAGYQQFLVDSASPFAGLDQYASILAGLPVGQTTTATGGGGGGGGGGGLAGGLSGALGGLGAAGALGLSNPITGALALGGGLLGAFG